VRPVEKNCREDDMVIKEMEVPGLLGGQSRLADRLCLARQIEHLGGHPGVNKTPDPEGHLLTSIWQPFPDARENRSMKFEFERRSLVIPVRSTEDRVPRTRTEGFALARYGLWSKNMSHED